MKTYYLMKKSIYLSVLFVCFISCGSTENKKENEDEKKVPSLFHVKIEKPDVSSLQPLRLSEFADSIEYLQLETTDKCLLPYYGTANMSRQGNSLFISELHTILRFDAVTGKFICKIGNKGQGPQEYIQINNVRVDEDNNRVIVKAGYKKELMMYTYEGKYLGQINLDDMEEARFPSCYYALSLVDIDSQYMIFIAEIMSAEQACQPHEVIVYDYKNKKTRHTLPNRMGGVFERHTTNMNGMQGGTRYDGKLFHKSFYNDTLYAVDKEKGIQPYAIIDLGQRKLPVEVVFSKKQYAEKTGKIVINNMFINRNCILLQCQLFNDDTLKDISSFLCKYDVNTGSLTYHSYLLNDIDGGPNILGINHLSRKIVCIPPSDVIDEKAKKVFFSTLDKSELKYPELKDKFEHMQESRNSDDNPLLMMLFLK